MEPAKGQEEFLDITDSDINALNKFIFKWIQRTLEFDTVRTLQLNTFLLNYFLIQNYFPSIEIVDYRLALKDYSEKELQECEAFRTYVERIHGIYILIPLLYKHEKKVSKGETDRRIAALDAYGEVVNSFFMLNTNPEGIKNEEFLDSLDNLITYESWHPNLNFDPEFQKILTSKAFKQIYNITTPTKYLQSQGIQRYNYPIDEKLNMERVEALKNPAKLIFKVNPELGALKDFLIEAANYIAVLDFGSHELIEEVISLFKKYFTLRIPSKKEEIDEVLTSFEVLFKISQGKLYKELTWMDLVKKLREKVSEQVANNFMKEFCLESQYRKFDHNFKHFDPTEFINLYHMFLKKAFYYHMGVIRTGVFSVWRAMLKYFEELQTEREFRTIKGNLLENWCYKKAGEYGFEPEKIILLNKNRPSNEIYLKMRDQIKSFLKPPLEFEFEFPSQLSHANFREIDFIIRHEHMIFLFECKGTVDPMSEEKEYIKWFNCYQKNMKLLEQKIELLNYGFDNNLIKHPVFEGLAGHLNILIQTEGLFEQHWVLIPEKMKYSLKNYEN